MWMRTTWVVLACVARIAPTSACAQELTWQTDGEVAVVEGQGGTTLRFRSGTATLQGRDMQDGSVSFVLKAMPARGFIGLRIREQSDGSYEDFYLRPHKNNAPDALQYTPSFSGADTNWQLVHRPRGTAPSPTQNTEEGIAVEIVFEGRNAAIFIGDDTEPALRVPRLALEPRTGRLTFWSSIMQPTEHELPVVLENIRVRPSSSRAIPAADPLVAPDGAVMAWGLGEAFRTNELAEEAPLVSTTRSVRPSRTGCSSSTAT